jgi:hypothetical protein
MLLFLALTLQSLPVRAASTTIDDFSTDQAQSTAISALASATMTDMLLIDNDSDGQVGPGEGIRYTVTVQNPDDAGDAAATDVVFAITPDANSALDVGRVTTTQGTVTSGNSGGDTTVAVDVGSIADAGTVTIVFDVTVNNPFPSDTSELIAQGTVSGSNVSDVSTDDPDDATSDSDTTNTPIVQPEIDVQGNSTSITDGDSTPDSADYTDFADMTVSSVVGRLFVPSPSAIQAVASFS